MKEPDVVVVSLAPRGHPRPQSFPRNLSSAKAGERESTAQTCPLRLLRTLSSMGR
jgi:hypothetical protein